MSWLEPPPLRRYAWRARVLLRLLRWRGRAGESVRQWARSPRAFLAFLRLYRAVDRDASPLEPALRSLVMVRVAQVNACASCVDLNGARAVERGAGAAKLAALADHAASPLFGPREKAALAFADAVTATGGAVPAEVRGALRDAFSDDEIVELAALVAFQNMSSKFNVALDVPAEGLCPVAPRGAEARATAER